jgi:CheY-like chemotaxis protein
MSGWVNSPWMSFDRRIAGSALAAVEEDSSSTYWPEIGIQGPSGIQWVEPVSGFLAMHSLRLRRVREESTAWKDSIGPELWTVIEAILETVDTALRDTDGPVDWREAVDCYCRSMLAFVSDLVDLIAIETGDLEWTSVASDVPEVLRRAMYPMMTVAAGKGLDFELKIDPRLPDRLLADERMLSRIVTCMAENGIASTSSGSVRIAVFWDRDSRGEGPALRILASDTGLSIPHEFVARAFERSCPGAGLKWHRKGNETLGLTFVKALVEYVGGTVSAGSNSNCGAYFSVSIPIGTPLLAGPVSPGERGNFAPLRGRRVAGDDSVWVLVGEHNDKNFATVQYHLTQAGFKVQRATSGLEAVSACAAWSYHLILMELELPEMSGIDAVRAIRQLESRAGRPPVPIVAVTSYGVSGYRTRCIEAGCNSYISKPIARQLLLDTVVSALGLAQVPA